MRVRVVEIPVHDLVVTTWDRVTEHVRIAAGTVERALELAKKGHHNVCELAPGELSPLPAGARVVLVPVIDGPVQDGDITTEDP